MALSITWTLKQAERQHAAIQSRQKKGWFMWTGSYGIVDRIVGYHKRKGWIADTCYYTGNHWIADFWKAFSTPNGFIRITRFI